MTRVAVTLCTFRREAVADTLRSLLVQDLPDGVSMTIVVADNDDTPSGRAAVEAVARNARWPIRYVHAPARNISIARNAGLRAADDADWVAFLDDDETADPDWLAQLLRCALDNGADAAFGPALADYGPEAPDWMRRQDYHSNIPVRNAGTVITGHTCNALLRWRGAPWQDQQFDLARGRSGGEDTAFFLALHRAGARFAICDTAIVREPVSPGRLSFGWIARRKFRSGQSYAASAPGLSARGILAATAAAKASLCAGAALVSLPLTGRRNFWALRGILHLGVIAGCMALPQAETYGTAEG